VSPTLSLHHQPYTSSLIRPRTAHLLTVPTMGGFDFSNHGRNAALFSKGAALPKATSTGTTIVGCLFDGGVVIAADTRATQGPIVADKVCFRQNETIGLTLCDRTARNFIIFLLRFGVPEPVPPPTLSSQQHLLHRIWNSIRYQLAVNLVSSLA
jgi:hypothetical protein